MLYAISHIFGILVFYVSPDKAQCPVYIAIYMVDFQENPLMVSTKGIWRMIESQIPVRDEFKKLLDILEPITCTTRHLDGLNSMSFMASSVENMSMSF